MSRPSVSLAGVLALVAAGLVAGYLTTPSSEAGTPTGPIAVESTSAVCPSRQTGGSVGVAAPGEGGGPGEAALTEPAPPGEPAEQVLALDTPGTSRSKGVRRGSPLVLRGEGALAPGLSGAQTTEYDDALRRGLAGAECTAPGADFWFVGAGSEPGHRGRLELTNSDAVPAEIDITLFGAKGPLNPAGGKSVTVAPGETEVRLLDALAPGEPVLAVHVTARTGRVSAALHDEQSDGISPKGADWIPQAAVPSREVVVPGVPGGKGARTLSVVAPGDSDAVVELRLVGKDGTFVPTEVGTLEVKAGTTRSVDLSKATRGEAVSVLLTSDEPVTAGVRADRGKPSDLAYTAAAPPLSQPAVLPDLPTGGDWASQLVLSAVGASDAAVDVQALGPEGPVGEPERVEIPAGSTKVVELKEPRGLDTFTAVVTPVEGSGAVAGSRLLQSGKGADATTTLVPLRSGRFTVRVPDVVHDLSAGLRPGSD